MLSSLPQNTYTIIDLISLAQSQPVVFQDLLRKNPELKNVSDESGNNIFCYMVINGWVHGMTAIMQFIDIDYTYTNKAGQNYFDLALVYFRYDLVFALLINDSFLRANVDKMFSFRSPLKRFVLGLHPDSNYWDMLFDFILKSKFAMQEVLLSEFLFECIEQQKPHYLDLLFSEKNKSYQDYLEITDPYTDDSLLHAAIRTGNMQSVDILLKHKISLTKRNGDNFTPLMLSISLKADIQTEISKKIIQHSSDEVLAISTVLGNCVNVATYYNKIEILRFLKARNVNPNISSRHYGSKTPLSIALHAHQKECFCELLSFELINPNKNIANNENSTVIHQAFLLHDAFYANALIDLEVNKKSALSYYSRPEKRFFIDFNVKDNKGKTPIVYAVEKNNIILFRSIYRRLSLTNFDINAASNNPNSPYSILHICFNNYHDAYHSGDKEFGFSALKFMEMLIKSGASVNTVDRNNSTILILAAMYGFKDVLECIVNNAINLDVNKSDIRGNTALMYAAEAASTQMALVLLKKGCDLNHKNNLGRTVFDLPLKPEMFRLLSEYKPQAIVERSYQLIHNEDIDVAFPAVINAFVAQMQIINKKAYNLSKIEHLKPLLKEVGDLFAFISGNINVESSINDALPSLTKQQTEIIAEASEIKQRLQGCYIALMQLNAAIGDDFSNRVIENFNLEKPLRRSSSSPLLTAFQNAKSESSMEIFDEKTSHHTEFKQLKP